MSKGLKIVIAVALTVIAGIIFLFSYQGSTEPIKKVADQLKVDPNWKRVTDSAYPPRFICLGDNACPSLHRSWDAGKRLDKTEFEALIKKSGWNLVIEDGCEFSDDKSSSCWANGRVDDFDVILRAHSSIGEKTEVALSIDQVF